MLFRNPDRSGGWLGYGLGASLHPCVCGCDLVPGLAYWGVVLIFCWCLLTRRTKVLFVIVFLSQFCVEIKKVEESHIINDNWVADVIKWEGHDYWKFDTWVMCAAHR